MEEDESGEDEGEDEVTFMDINNILQNSGGEDDDAEGDGVAIILPPHHRCASHTLNLVSCTDVDKWLLSRPDSKALYRSAIAKCTAIYGTNLAIQLWLLRLWMMSLQGSFWSLVLQDGTLCTMPLFESEKSLSLYSTPSPPG